jgi:hypothetical protein
LNLIRANEQLSNGELYERYLAVIGRIFKPIEETGYHIYCKSNSENEGQRTPRTKINQPLEEVDLEILEDEVNEEEQAFYIIIIRY